MSDATKQAHPTTTEVSGVPAIRTVHQVIIPPQHRFEPKSFTELERFADMAIRSDILGPTYKNEGYVLMVVMKGASLGLSCMESINWIYPIPSQGGGCRLSYAAELIGARFLKAGGTITWLETTEKKARVRLEFSGRSHEHEFTMGDAVLAGLDKKFNWKSYPQAMLRNRALTAGIRAFRPDISSGLYDPDELGAEVTDRGELVADANGQPVVHAIDAPADAQVVKPEAAGKPKLSKEARDRVSAAARDLATAMACTVEDPKDREALLSGDDSAIKKVVAERVERDLKRKPACDADLDELAELMKKEAAWFRENGPASDLPL